VCFIRYHSQNGQIRRRHYGFPRYHVIFIVYVVSKYPREPIFQLVPVIFVLRLCCVRRYPYLAMYLDFLARLPPFFFEHLDARQFSLLTLALPITYESGYTIQTSYFSFVALEETNKTMGSFETR
jgi:hypothetical protein